MCERITRDLAINRFADGSVAPQAGGEDDGAFRSGPPVHQLQLEAFLKTHHLKPSMLRRGKCHENALAESFFSC